MMKAKEIAAALMGFDPEAFVYVNFHPVTDVALIGAKGDGHLELSVDELHVLSQEQR